MNNFARPLLFATALVSISACSGSLNKITRSEGLPTNAAEIVDNGERFKNLYKSPKTYPYSCEQGCYLPDQRVTCQQEAQDCQVSWPDMAPLVDAQIQWTGHASFRLLTNNQQLFLFDPVKAGFDWPVNWLGTLFGVNRPRPDFELLSADTAPTALLYSHNHYDHYNADDAVEQAKGATILLPFGMAETLPNSGLKLHEMAWYGEHTIDDTTIHFIPAHHFAGRGIYELDGDTSLWGGWLIEQADQTIYFAGDTGYSPIFKDIRQRFGPISVCLIPIASYSGENYRNAHLTPEDALTVADELGCERMIPWGYGNYSWLMGDKSSHSALLRLLNAHREMKSKISLQVLNEGEIVRI